MTVSETARQERKLWARNQCEARTLHHPDCPGEATPANESQFVLHHVIRRGDTDADQYEHRDDVVHLRFLWNGPTGLGLAGCHAETHRNQTKARELGLLAERPRPFPNFQRPIELVDTPIGPIPRSTLNAQPAHIQKALDQ